MTGLIPDPPDGDPRDWTSRVAAHTATGIYGGCVMCADGTYDWFDLTLADLPPVVDRTGTPTDQVALHPRCVPVLVEHWRTLAGEAPCAGDSPTAPDVAPGAGGPTTDLFPSRPARRAPMGVYAQHWGQ